MPTGLSTFPRMRMDLLGKFLVFDGLRKEPRELNKKTPPVTEYKSGCPIRIKERLREWRRRRVGSK